MKHLTLLGATGSVGSQTLEVIRQHPNAFKVIALTAHQNITLLHAQCIEFKPEYAVVETEEQAMCLQTQLRTAGIMTQVLFGPLGLEQVVSLSKVDTVMAAIVGAAGLLPLFAAIRAKKQILLANKEALVMAGMLVVEEAKRAQVEVLPVDSEHNAIFQCIRNDKWILGEKPSDLSKVILTASGGAFRDRAPAQLAQVTPEEACCHPNWSMGKKISVDSATLMNKGFEVIEAAILFGLNAEQIDVVLHPQSFVHSFVEYIDGSVLAQLAQPDMRIPIAYALGWPGRLPNPAPKLDFNQMAKLEFSPIDFQRYPCLNLAYQALRCGGTAATILNAANEVAVTAFLAGKIKFTDIAYFNQQVFQQIQPQSAESIHVILEADRLARNITQTLILKSYGLVSDTAMI